MSSDERRSGRMTARRDGDRAAVLGRLAALAVPALLAACDSSSGGQATLPAGEVAAAEPRPSSDLDDPAVSSAPGSALQPRTVVVVQAPADERPVRYTPWAIELEVGEVPVAAYQVELIVRAGDATIVGVEGGTTDGFREPPFYDPRALAGGRIVLAAFHTRVALTRGRHRVATVHLREAGPAPAYELRLAAAGAPDGSPAAAGVDLVSGKGDER